MSTYAIARRWAKALFELGTETGSIDTVYSQVKELADMVAASPELQNVLSNPLIAPETRRAVLQEITQRAGTSQLVRNAVFLLTDNRRGHLLPRVATVLSEMADEQAGKIRAEVTSATALSEEQYQRLARSLEKLTGRKIALSRKVDPSIVGGVITRVGDKIYDGSVRSRLAELRQSLLAN